MNKLPLSLFSRLYLSIVIVIIVCVSLTKFVVDIYYKQEEFNYFVRDINYIVKSIPVRKSTKSSQKINELIYLKEPYNEDFIARVRTLKPEEKICDTCQFLTISENIEYYEREDESLIALYRQPDTQLAIIISHIVDNEAEAAYFSYTSVNEISYFMIILITSLFIGLTIYWPIKHLQIQIKKLIYSHHQFGANNLSIRADEKLQKPLDELACSFNVMAQAIAESVQERDTFSQAIPHEIRTPLSRIQLASDLIRRKTSDEGISALAQNVEDYVVDINQLISQIVDYSRLNSIRAEGGFDEEQVINLAKFVESRLLLLINKQGKEVEKSINVDISDSIEITTTPVYLRLIIDNFIKNAVNHAKSKIYISASYHEEQFQLVVEDDGVGIPLSERATVFIPFARLDKSRSRKTGGLGLGLPIAKAAARKMQGTIDISDSPLGGARFRFTI